MRGLPDRSSSSSGCSPHAGQRKQRRGMAPAMAQPAQAVSDGAGTTGGLGRRWRIHTEGEQAPGRSVTAAQCDARGNGRQRPIEGCGRCVGVSGRRWLWLDVERRTRRAGTEEEPQWPWRMEMDMSSSGGCGRQGKELRGAEEVEGPLHRPGEVSGTL